MSLLIYHQKELEKSIERKRMSKKLGINKDRNKKEYLKKKKKVKKEKEFFILLFHEEIVSF